MIVRIRVLLLFLAATVYASNSQTSNSSNDNKQQQQQQSSILEEPITFKTKTKDTCDMVLSAVGNYTRLRVSCNSQAPGRYYCDFQGKPSLCRAYNLKPRHYFTQMMWELRKLKHACQGDKIYRPHMCKKYPDEAQMKFLASGPKTTIAKPSKPVQETRKTGVPAQTKPIATSKPVKPQSPPIKPQSGKVKKTPLKPAKTTHRPTEQPDSTASRLASEYCWKSLHNVCTYFISWFQE